MHVKKPVALRRTDIMLFQRINIRTLSSIITITFAMISNGCVKVGTERVRSFPIEMQGTWICDDWTRLFVRGDRFLYTINYSHPRVSIPGECSHVCEKNGRYRLICTPPVIDLATRVIVAEIGRTKCKGYSGIESPNIVAQLCAKQLLKDRMNRINIVLRRRRTSSVELVFPDNGRTCKRVRQ
jgi:hypothetical protein